MAGIASYRPEVKILVGKGKTDISKNLGDAGSVSLRKDLRAPMGEAVIDFPDMPAPGGLARDSLYGTTAVMDPIEIKMRAGTGPVWVTVLRGFIRGIERNEQVGGDGRVQRRVTLHAHDCGAAFVMESVHQFISWQNQGKNRPPPFDWLAEYQLESTPKPIATFMLQLASNSTKDIMAAAGFAFIPKMTVKKGAVNPCAVFTDQGTIWSMMSMYADMPWNELFVRESEAGPELVFRPTPWRTIHGVPLPDVDPADLVDDLFRIVPVSNVVSLHAQRDDAELVQHVWVTSPNFTQAMVSAMGVRAGTINPETKAKFGDRFQALRTVLIPDEGSVLLNQKEPDFKSSSESYDQWLSDRITWARMAGEDTHEFERGTLTIKGDPTVRVGDYFRVKRGALAWDGYCVAVSHDFQPYRQYLTTIEYIRGNQWVRRQLLPNAWDLERAGGVGAVTAALGAFI